MAAETSSPASYAARLSAMGGETRRSSFGAPKLSLEELEEDGGLIDKALAFPVPSNIEMYNPFKVVTDPEDEHFQFEEDNAENVSDYCTMCSELLTEARKSLLAEKIKVVTKIQLMEKQEFSERMKSIVPQVSESLTRNDIIHATTVMALEEVNLAPTVENAIRTVLEKKVYPIQDQVFEQDLKDAKKATSDLVKQVVARGLSLAAGNVEIAPSHAHFIESVTNLKKIYACLTSGV